MHKLRNIILPGWGIGMEHYSVLSEQPAEIYDFGFFSGSPSGLPPVFDSAINDLCSSPCLITAHSLGSILAFGKIPDLPNVKALIVYSGFAKFAKSDDNLSGQPVETILAMKKQLRNNTAGLLKSFYRNMSFPSQYEFKTPETPNVSTLAAGLDILLDCDFRNRLAEIKIPVLIIHGAEDRIVYVKMAEELVGKIKFSRLYVFKNAGHAVPFTHSNESKTITETFLRDYDIH